MWGEGLIVPQNQHLPSSLSSSFSSLSPPSPSFSFPPSLSISEVSEVGEGHRASWKPGNVEWEGRGESPEVWRGGGGRGGVERGRGRGGVEGDWGRGGGG